MVFGALSALVVLLGLVAAAKGDEGLQLAGLVFVLFGLGGVGSAIHLHFKRYEEELKAHPKPAPAAQSDSSAPAAKESAAPNPVPLRSSLPPSRPVSGRESMFTPVVMQWIKGAAVGIGGILGLLYAAASHGGSGQYIGIMVALVAIIWIFQMITRAIGGGSGHDSGGWALFPVPQTSTGLMVRAGQIIVVGIIALGVAAKTHDMGLQYAALFVFGAAIFYIFRLIHEGIGNH